MVWEEDKRLWRPTGLYRSLLLESSIFPDPRQVLVAVYCFIYTFAIETVEDHKIMSTLLILGLPGHKMIEPTFPNICMFIQLQDFESSALFREMSYIDIEAYRGRLLERQRRRQVARDEARKSAPEV